MNAGKPGGHIGVPFLLAPAGKDYIWGGNRLRTEYNKELGLDPLAETWECSTHPDGLSVAANGVHEGMSLRQILKMHPEYMGTHAEAYGGKEGELPILIKFIDAGKDLSIQVHPNDEYARIHEKGQMGKTEMWYVLDAAPGASLIYGFCENVTEDTLRKGLVDGSIGRYFQKVPVRGGEVFLVKAGTVHAIGAGTLLVEIQENSNLTYRLYDYNRVDREGRKRPLHVKKALEVARLEREAEPEQPLHLWRYREGYASELLCRCRYFQVERYLMDTEPVNVPAEFVSTRDSFQVFLCLDGNGTICLGDEGGFDFRKGDCIFAPANVNEIRMLGKAELLNVRC